MILSNISIQKAIDNEYIKIDPEPLPRERSQGVECPYQTTSVDLRLHEEVVWLEGDLGVSMKLTRGSFNKLAGRVSKRLKITDEQPLVLRPGKLVLGKTIEKLSLPLPPPESNRPCYAARIEGRSSFARCGLLVHFTAPTIHAGYSGHITLEMYNMDPYSIELSAGERVCQLIIEEVAGTPFRNDSQFQEARTDSPVETRS